MALSNFIQQALFQGRPGPQRLANQRRQDTQQNQIAQLLQQVQLRSGQLSNTQQQGAIKGQGLSNQLQELRIKKAKQPQQNVFITKEGRDGNTYELEIDPNTKQIVGKPRLVGGLGQKKQEPLKIPSQLMDHLPIEIQARPETVTVQDLVGAADKFKQAETVKPTDLETFEKKEVIKQQVRAAAEKNKSSRGSNIALKDALDFHAKIKFGEFSTGTTQSVLNAFPGKFTEQSKLNEQFDAFAERAAREALKAVGEVRPTDADVVGMKKAIFGVGKDESTNLKLLENFIREKGGTVPTDGNASALPQGTVDNGDGTFTLLTGERIRRKQ